MNILSFDIEEWFQVSNFEKYIKPEEWDSLEQRVNVGTDFFLDTLKKKNIKATFFLVGWVAERNEEMVAKISADGHEIGIHGYMHKCITDQTISEFEADIKKSIKVVSDITGKQVKGYRAPSYTITPKTEWALEVLHANGIEYDSSLYPTSFKSAYGFPNSPRYPFRFKNGLYEFPMSTFPTPFGNLPFASGGYFRLAPYLFTKVLMKHYVSKGEMFTINIHQWEMDPGQKVIETRWYDNFRHYTNLKSNKGKFDKFTNDFDFTTFEDFIPKHDFPIVEIEDGHFKFN